MISQRRVCSHLSLNRCHHPFFLRGPCCQVEGVLVCPHLLFVFIHIIQSRTDANRLPEFDHLPFLIDHREQWHLLYFVHSCLDHLRVETCLLPFRHHLDHLLGEPFEPFVV